MQHKVLCSLCMAAFLALPAAAQDAQSTTPPANSTADQQVTDTQQKTDANGNVVQMEQTPVFRVNVVERSLDAVNYQHKNGSTKVDLVGTSLMPEARGDAKVNGHTGRLSIGTDFSHMRPATAFGPQWLTYVLWAITPNGRPVNLGEVVPNKDGNFNMQVTTDLQAFGLMVTAEPYFAVTRPSNMVVMENQIRRDTKGWDQPVTAKYELLERGEYTSDLDPNQLPATGADVTKVPLDLLEARNAVAIAKSEGADKYAPDAMARAKEFLEKGEDYYQRKQSRSAIGTVTRGAIQNAEDARLISLRAKREEKVAAERAEQQRRVEEARQRAESEADRAREAQTQASQAEQARLQAQQEREAALQAQKDAEAAAQRAAQERAAADQARAAAEEQQRQLASQAQQAQTQAQQAQLAAQQAEREKEETRTRLMTQLNQVLQTKDTARGLIVNMSDVLFDFNKSTLKPGAKLRLAKVAGIIQAYPDLRLQIEGFTDNVGKPDYNQKLSERRAQTVRDFLASQGVNQQNITAQGFGESNPVASNDTAAGRQMNRRVDLVVSGESIQSARSQQQPGGVAPTAPGTAGAVGAASNSAAPAGTTTQPATASPSTSNPASGVNTPAAPNTQPQTTQPQTTSPQTTTPPPAQNAPTTGTSTPPPDNSTQQTPPPTTPRV